MSVISVNISKVSAETSAGDGCIFCRIVEMSAPAHRLHVDEQVVAFLDINPATPGHTLIIPRVHVPDIHDISADDLAACASVAKVVARRLTDRLGADGVNLLHSAGKAAWQGVFHFHLHVVPRYAGDALREPWRRVPETPVQLAAIAAKLS